MSRPKLELAALDVGAPGAELLDAVETFLGRFVAYPSEAARIAHALWVAHAHTMSAWESSPRIAFLSPEPASGKTRALEITVLLVPNPVEAVNVSPAYLFRKVATGVTILFDEIDTVFGPRAKENEEIRGLLNAGHRRGAVAGRCVVVGNRVETEEIPAFCAVALAGLDDLPDTLMTRAVVVRMRRRAPDEQVESYRRRVHGQEGEDLQKRLAEWAELIREEVTGAWPKMPPGVEDRNADVWEPLLAVADAARGTWPERARRAAVELVAVVQDREQSLGVRLLADLRTVFGTADAMSTEAILLKLTALDESPWADLRGKALDARGLGTRLRKYGASSRNVRIADKVAKGYSRADLHDAWARYLPAPAGKAATSVTRATAQLPELGDVADVADVAALWEPERDCAGELGPCAGCSGRTHRYGPAGAPCALPAPQRRRTRRD